MSAPTLSIAPGLDLPLKAVTETFAILAKRGKGKTNTAVVMTEEMIRAGIPVVVLDPVGVWWGLRSTADGQGEGLPVVIFGGDHADVPLEEKAGELIADVIVDRRMSAVIDLSSLSKAAARRFMGPFVERLYHRNREALHVVVDEADAFAPQRAQADGLRLLGAMEDLVRRGRARGIGVTLITQRPAVLHKDVLTQAEVLVALGMTGPRDVAAIDEWVRLHADEDQARQVKASLPTLQVGDAWVWSPGWLDILQRVHIRARTTFDSSATPKPGEKRITPQRLADVDLEQLGEQITATVERAKADDPKALRARIRQLEHELQQARDAKPEAVVETVEVPVVTDAQLEQYSDLAGQLLEVLAGVEGRLQQVAQNSHQEAATGQPTTRRSAPRATSTSSDSRRARDAGASAHREKDPSPAREMRPGPAGGPVKLGKTEGKVMAVLAQHGPCSHGRVCLLAGYSPKSSTVGNSASKLRAAGYLEEGQPYVATAAGLDWLGDYDPLPTGGALIEYWRSRFGLTEQRVLDALLELHPEPGSVSRVCELTGYSPTSSTVGNAASKLRGAGVLDGWRLSQDFADQAGLDR